MNKALLIVICIVVVPMLLLAATTDAEKMNNMAADGSSGQGGTPAAVRHGMNLGRQTVIDSIPAPGTQHMGLAWDGTYLYSVSQSLTPKVVYQIDPQTGTVVNTITTAITANVLGCTYLNGSLWIQSFANGMTYEVDPTTGATLSSFMSPAGTSSRGLANDGTNLWIMDAPNAIAYLVTTTGTVNAVGNGRNLEFSTRNTLRRGQQRRRRHK
jgi:glutamine cyclotransferase